MTGTKASIRRHRRVAQHGTPALVTAISSAIRRIPRGRVSTYGAIARAAGYPRCARHVARVLKMVDGLPWQRVLGSGGRISLRGELGLEQRFLLEAEGVRFRGRRVDMKAFEHRFGALGKVAGCGRLKADTPKVASGELNFALVRSSACFKIAAVLRFLPRYAFSGSLSTACRSRDCVFRDLAACATLLWARPSRLSPADTDETSGFAIHAFESASDVHQRWAQPEQCRWSECRGSWPGFECQSRYDQPAESWRSPASVARTSS